MGSADIDGVLFHLPSSCPKGIGPFPTIPTNVNPGIIHLWLINRRVSPFSGDSSLLEGTPP